MEEEKEMDLDLTIKQLKEMLEKREEIAEMILQNKKTSCTVETISYVADITIREKKGAITNV